MAEPYADPKELTMLRSLVENLSVGIVSHDATGKILFANPAIGQLFGLREKDAVGRNVREFLPEESGARVQRERERRKPGEKSTYELDIVRADGEKRRVVVSAMSTFDAAGVYSGSFAVVQDVTDRHKAEEALRKSEENYRTIYMEAPVGIYRSTFDGKILSVNPAFARMLGYDSPEQFIAVVNRKSAAEVVYADPSRRSNVIADMLRAPGWLKLQNRYRHREGRTVIVNLMTRIAWSPDSSRRELEGFAEDITERVLAEEELSRQRALLLALMEGSPDAIYFKDRECRFLLNNRAHALMLGARDPEEMRGRSDFDYFVAEDAEQFSEEERRVMETGEPLVNRVERIARQDRPVRWATATKTPLRNEKGEIVGTFGITRDITEAHEIEERNLRLAAMVDSSNDAIIGLDLDGNVTSWNGGAATILGYSSEETLGRPIDTLLPPEIVNRRPVLHAPLEAKKDAEQIESTVNRKDGKDIIVSSTISWIKDSGGTNIGVMIISRDVTEQRALQAKIIRAQRLESLGTLAAGIAHQFNNINAAMLAYLDLVVRNPDVGETVRSHVQEALKAMQRSVAITARLQGLTSASSDFRGVLRLEAAVSSTLSLFSQQFEAEGISLTTDFKPVPPVRATLDMVTFVVTSLITNSIQALNGMLARSISVRTREEPGYATLEVRDTGCGIEPENLSRIFTPFFTTKGEWAAPGSSQARVKGIGLSLAVCQSTVSESGGWIDVQSVRGAGATFRVWLPAAAPERPEADASG